MELGSVKARYCKISKGDVLTVSCKSATYGEARFETTGGEIRAKRLLLLGGFLSWGGLLGESFGRIGGCSRGQCGRSGEGGGFTGEAIITALIRVGFDEAFLQQDRC